MLTDQDRISTALIFVIPPVLGAERKWMLALTLGFMLMCVGCSGPGKTSGSGFQREPVKTLEPQTTTVLSLVGESLGDISHRTGFSLSVLESLNPSLAGVRLSAGVEVRCPVGQPGIRRVEGRTPKGSRE